MSSPTTTRAERKKAHYKRWCETNRDYVREWARKYYAKNRVRLAKEKRLWRAANRGADVIYHRSYRITNKARINRLRRDRYRKNPTPFKARAKEYQKRLTPQQRAKHRESSNRHYLANKEKKYINTLKWRLANPEKMRGYCRKWQKRNAKARQTKKMSYELNRRRTDPHYRFIQYLRNALRQRLVKNGTVKSNRFNVLLGCSTTGLVTYIESLFCDGMGWHNRRQWHVDHIIPLAAFDLSLEVDQRACFHFSNLRPVWKLVNLKKACSVDKALIAEWSPKFSQPRLKEKAQELLKGGCVK